MVDTAFLNTFLFVLVRMSGCIFLNPIFGRKDIPALYKVGLSLVLSLAVTSFTGVYVNEAIGIFTVVLLAREFFIGFAIGFVISLFSYVVSFGGEVMDMQMGVSMSKIYDPGSNVSLSLSATIFNILYMLLFFSASGHITMIRLFLLTGDVLPYGGFAINTGVTEAVLGIFCQCTVMAVKFALPIIAIELLMEVGIGIIMKAVPQINVFVVNIQAKLLVGLILIVLLFVPLSEFLERMVTTMFGVLETVLFSMA